MLIFTAAKRRPRLCGVLQVSGGDLRKAVTTLQSSVRLGGTQVSRWVQDAGPVYAAVKVGVCTYTCMFDSQDNGTRGATCAKCTANTPGSPSAVVWVWDLVCGVSAGPQLTRHIMMVLFRPRLFHIPSVK